MAREKQTKALTEEDLHQDDELELFQEESPDDPEAEKDEEFDGLEAEPVEKGESHGDLNLQWLAFLKTLPLLERAILEIYQSQPPDFGWLIGRNEYGHLIPLELGKAQTAAWMQALTALQRNETGVATHRQEPWKGPLDFAKLWKERGPGLYRLINVDLPNLRDISPLLATEFGKRHASNKAGPVTLAVAKVLSSKPVEYWWLVFGPAIEDWDGLFTTLQEHYAEAGASGARESLPATWNREGRPVVLAGLESASRGGWSSIGMPL